MFCPNCGNKIDSSSKFCEMCGSKLEERNAPVQSPYVVPVKADEFGIVLSDCNSNVAGLLALFFGAIGVHDFYCGNSKEGAEKLLCIVISIIAAFFPFIILSTRWTVSDVAAISIISGILSFITIIIPFSWGISDLYKIGNGTYCDGKGYYLEAAPWAKIIVILQFLFLIVSIIAIIGASGATIGFLNSLHF